MVRFLIISVLFATFVRVEYWFLGAIDPLALPSIFATACVCLALLTERHHVWPIWIGVSLGWMLCWPEGASWVWALCSLLLGAGTGLHSYIAWRALSYRPRSSVPSFSFIVRRLLGVGPLGAIGSALFVGLAAVCAGIHDAGSVAYYTLCVWLVNATFPILFTPFMLFFFKRLGRGRGLSREFFGVLLVLVLFVCLLRWVGLVSEQSTQRDARRQQVSRYESRFRRHIDLSFALLYSINSFFQSSDKVTRKEFETFTHQLIKQARGIMAFSWNPVVLAKEREAFEKQTRQEGFSHFSISERRKQGTMVRAAHRPLYVPVRYIVPLSRNRAAFGFDLYSNAKRRLALERARDSGKPVATDRIILVQEKQSTWAVIVFFPVYDWRVRVPITNVTMRRKHLRGYLSAVFRISDMLRAAIPSSGRSQWLLRCTDKGAAPAKATLWQDEEVFDAPSLRMLLVGQRRSFSDAVTLPFADRIWQIHFQQRMGQGNRMPDPNKSGT